ncbi:MAG: DUF4363 family protein [Clostridia bacterium]|nr:DUF4363 family protein [Clostridia bacterium]
MTRGKGYTIVSILSVIIAIGMLVFAFIAPARYIGEMKENMGFHVQRAKDAVMTGDMVTAEDGIEEIYLEFQRRQDKLKLMCHHDNIDEMEKSINCCRDLVRMEQSDNLICELNELSQILEHMESVENADIYEVF